MINPCQTCRFVCKWDKTPYSVGSVDVYYDPNPGCWIKVNNNWIYDGIEFILVGSGSDDKPEHQYMGSFAIINGKLAYRYELPSYWDELKHLTSEAVDRMLGMPRTTKPDFTITIDPVKYFKDQFKRILKP